MDDLKTFDALCRQMGMVGGHSSYLRALEQARAYASHPVNVLIVGEPGVGRLSFAKLIHRIRHPQRDFYCADCALSEGFMKAEILEGPPLRSGNDVVSIKSKLGCDERNTLILRDVHQVSANFMGNVRSFLNSGQLEREKFGKVCLLATAREEGVSLCSDGEAVESFSRLFGSVLRLPALRERRSDVVPLAQAFLDGWNVKNRRSLKFEPEALRKLKAYDWPGNLPELRVAVEEAAMLCQREIISSKTIQFDRVAIQSHALPVDDSKLEVGFDLDQSLDRMKRRWIAKALEQAGGNKAFAARLLGWSPQRLHSHLNKRES